MSTPDEIQRLAELTERHPEVALELVDRQGIIRFILFNGMDHPECMPTGGRRAEETTGDAAGAVVAANLYPREQYQENALMDYEPLATGVSLDEAARLIEEA
jgi:hypothetical protein